MSKHRFVAGVSLFSETLCTHENCYRPVFHDCHLRDSENTTLPEVEGTLRAAQGDGQPPPLSWQVRLLEAEAERLRSIGCEIIATLRVNIERGTLKSDSPKAFNKIVNQWALRIGDTEEPALAAVAHNEEK